MSTSTTLHEQRAKLVESKLTLSNQLSAIKQRLTVTLPRETFAQHEKQRIDLVRQIQMIDSELASLNAKKHSAAQRDDEAKIQEKAKLKDKVPVRALVELREKYQQFSADGSRVASMRRMASEFVLELNPIIKRMVSKSDDTPL